MNKEEQKKLLTEMMEADAKDGLYKQDISKMETTKTAVDYLVLIVQKCIAPNYIPIEIVQQAKAMEKEQIIKAFNEGENNIVDYYNPENRIVESEQYYNETYNK